MNFNAISLREKLLCGISFSLKPNHATHKAGLIDQEALATTCIYLLLWTEQE